MKSHIKKKKDNKLKDGKDFQNFIFKCKKEMYFYFESYMKSKLKLKLMLYKYKRKLPTVKKKILCIWKRKTNKKFVIEIREGFKSIVERVPYFLMCDGLTKENFTNDEFIIKLRFKFEVFLRDKKFIDDWINELVKMSK